MKPDDSIAATAPLPFYKVVANGGRHWKCFATHKEANDYLVAFLACKGTIYTLDMTGEWAKLSPSKKEQAAEHLRKVQDKYAGQPVLCAAITFLLAQVKE